MMLGNKCLEGKTWQKGRLCWKKKKKTQVQPPAKANSSSTFSGAQIQQMISASEGNSPFAGRLKDEELKELWPGENKCRSSSKSLLREQ